MKQQLFSVDDCENIYPQFLLKDHSAALISVIVNKFCCHFSELHIS